MIRTQKYTITIILLVTFASVANSKLEVTNLDQMNPSLIDDDLKDIPYSIANFGFAPFGKTLVGHLEETPGLSNQCVVDASEAPKPSIQTSFLLIPRGECPFVTKAIHAQELGAKVAIIMDNQDHDGRIIMKDNGYGYKVKIPSIFINYKMGQKLKALLSQSNVQINLRINFENIKSEKAEVVVYMQSLNRLSYYFVQQFKPYYNLIKNHINFKVAYNVINCPMCSAEDCYNDGQYCSVSYEHGFSASGKLLLDQQIREQIMFEKHLQQWWSYMNCISNECNKIAEVKECSDKCLSRSQFSVKAEALGKQFTQSFDPNSDNSYLRRSMDLLKNSGVEAFPSVSINGVRVKGSVNAEFVFDDICNTLLKPPKQCSQYIVERNNSVEIHNSYWITIVLVLLLSAVLFVGLFIFCRRRMRSKMTAEMQGRVDDMVSKYIEFYSERRNNK